MTSRQPMVVLGATGNQGGHVARALLEAGWPVRAITRHPESPRARALVSSGAELVQADMGDVDTLIRAFEGAGGIFSVQNFWDLGLREEVRLGTNVIEAAQAVGNPHVVYSSGLGAERLQGVAAIDGKAMLEERLRQSGLPFTILRPGLFMDDFLGASLPFARPIQRLLQNSRPLVGRLFLALLRATVPQRKCISLTTLADVARVAVRSWTDPDIGVGQIHQVVSCSEKPEVLCVTWEQVTGQTLPRIPGAKLGIRLAHPKMAQLLEWLSCHPYGTCPCIMTNFQTWLESRSVPAANKR